MNIFTRIIAVAFLIIVIGVVITYKPASVPVAKQPVATIAFSCNAGKGIVAAFYGDATKTATTTPGQPPTSSGTVKLTLSDGRTMELTQTISADGVRYKNADESFVFWGRGNTALVLEGGKEQSYIGCIVIAPEQAGTSLPLTYSNSAAGFSIRLPQDYSVDEKYRYQQLGPGKDIMGIKFTIPASMATGTNLSSDSYVSVEGIPNTQTCTASLFLNKVKDLGANDGQLSYSVATSTGVSAGNRYDEAVFALPGTNPCIAVRYYIHYGVFQNYPAGTVREFDKQTLLAQFDSIRRSLIIVQ